MVVMVVSALLPPMLLQKPSESVTLQVAVNTMDLGERGDMRALV